MSYGYSNTSRGPRGKELRPSCQKPALKLAKFVEGATLEVDPPAPVNPSDDTNPN